MGHIFFNCLELGWIIEISLLMYLLFWQMIMEQSVVTWQDLIEYLDTIVQKHVCGGQGALEGQAVGDGTNILTSFVTLWPIGEK
jgi:hypothetical protein